MDKVTNDAVFLKSAKHKFLECFERFVKPYNVIDLFHKYNPNVLTEEDKCRVRAKSQNEGDISAAKFLFETLLSYADWYPCTIQVFRDPQVKLSHVADEMESIKVDFMNCFKRQEVELGEMCTHIFKVNMNDPHCLCKIKEARLKVNCELLQKQVTEEKQAVSKMNVQYNTLLNAHMLSKQQLIEEKERGFNNCGPNEDPNHLRIVELEQDLSGSFGINVAGGLNSPIGDVPVIIASLNPTGPAAFSGKLRAGDKILNINGTSTEGMTHEQVIRTMRAAKKVTLHVVQGEAISITGQRSRQVSGDISDTTLKNQNLEMEELDDDGQPPQYKTVTLNRGPDGLGFSIIVGHGSSHGDLPIYVKTVYNKLPEIRRINP